MTKAQGFARGDLDTAFPLDDKFLALRRRVTVERYYEATGVYFHLAAATWREAERKPVDKVCPDAGDIAADLIAVGLLDADGCVPRRAYMHTVGRAKANRRTAADRQARNRAGKSRVTERDDRVTARESRPARDSAPVTELSDVLSTGDARDDEPEWPVLSWLATVNATIQPNGNGYHRELVQLVDRRGAVAVVAAMKVRYAAGDRSARQLLYGAANDLEPISRPAPSKAKGLGPAKEEAERAFHG